MRQKVSLYPVSYSNAVPFLGIATRGALIDASSSTRSSEEVASTLTRTLDGLGFSDTDLVSRIIQDGTVWAGLARSSDIPIPNPPGALGEDAESASKVVTRRLISIADLTSEVASERLVWAREIGSQEAFEELVAALAGIDGLYYEYTEGLLCGMHTTARRSVIEFSVPFEVSLLLQAETLDVPPCLNREALSAELVPILDRIGPLLFEGATLRT